MPKAVAFLMFQGEAGAALELYQRAVPGFTLLDCKKYTQPEEMAGKVEMAFVKIGALECRVHDSEIKHAFSFTPALSFFLDLDSEEELRTAADALAEGGLALMPLDNYGFSRRFAWIQDRFGVSWQLNLP